MPESALARKLQIKPGHKIAIVNAPEGYREGLGQLPSGASIVDSLDSQVDLVQLFVKDSKELEALVQVAVQGVRQRGLLWICYPKGGSKVATDLNRDILWADMGKRGLAGVSMVSIDNIWSAMRFRPSGEVKSRA